MTTDTTMVNRLFDFSRGFILKCLTSFKIAVCAFFVSRDVASCEKQDKSRSRCKCDAHSKFLSFLRISATKSSRFTPYSTLPSLSRTDLFLPFSSLSPKIPFCSHACQVKLRKNISCGLVCLIGDMDNFDLDR